ncbi:MAG: helix-turn-helix domain-containing protein, partial [Oscillospiraceae bacterium]
MNSDFPRIITLLRKERGISQKNAAADLGISQALLSHYEKGIRECGLEFLVKAADYYNVSCDYLLGRSPEPAGKTLSYDDIPEQDTNSGKIAAGGSMMAAFNRKLIVNSL